MEKLDNIHKSQIQVVEEAKTNIVATIPNMVSEIELPDVSNNKSISLPFKKRVIGVENSSSSSSSSSSSAVSFQSPNGIIETFSPIFPSEGDSEKVIGSISISPGSFFGDADTATPTTIEKSSLFDFDEFSAKSISIDGLSALLADDLSTFSSIGTMEMMFADSAIYSSSADQLSPNPGIIPPEFIEKNNNLKEDSDDIEQELLQINRDQQLPPSSSSSSSSYPSSGIDNTNGNEDKTIIHNE